MKNIVKELRKASVSSTPKSFGKKLQNSKKYKASKAKHKQSKK